LKLKHPISPNVPAMRPLYSEPRDSVASSMTAMSYLRANSINGSHSQGWPRISTGRIAATLRPVSLFLSEPPTHSHFLTRKRSTKLPTDDTHPVSRHSLT